MDNKETGVMFLINTSVGSIQILCTDENDLLSHQEILEYGRELHKENNVNLPDTDISYNVRVVTIN